MFIQYTSVIMILFPRLVDVIGCDVSSGHRCFVLYSTVVSFIDCIKKCFS